MRDKSNNNEEATESHTGSHGHKPALQVICLGDSGGPSEESVTAFLVRSVESDWARGSVLAVDAGSHLAPIARILEEYFPRVSNKVRSGSYGGSANGSATQGATKALGRASLSPSPLSEDEQPLKPEPTILCRGPFAGLKFPHASAGANTLHVLHSYISTYLITHPHLDHISGFTINTAAFHATSKPKTLAALPSTVDAIKQHIFNDVIWPNLTDEDGGVGFVTFQRLKEGGDAMMGEGEGRGYIDVVDGLGVRAFKVSHGLCTKSPPSHIHRGSIAGLSDTQPVGGEQSQPMGRTASMQHSSGPGTPGVQQRNSFYSSHQHPSPRMTATTETSCVVDSTAYFIRDTGTAREVLIFGDVEPDSVSLCPRNRLVWQEASRKIAHHSLGGIFIECSYDDSQADAFLFGHLCPRHVIAELQVLAGLVSEARTARSLEHSVKKRKRSGANGLDARYAMGENDRKRSKSLAGGRLSSDLRRCSVPDTNMDDASTISPSLEVMNPVDNLSAGPLSPRSNSFLGSSSANNSHELPLHGIKVVIIHVKDTFKDGPHVSENILAQLQEYETRLRDDGQGLGCEFVISQSGESYWF
ncbi:3',5'-cyclic-nucleotide phosphodiesterase-like [Teratosphaeria destructans]|uniref:3',5'-cyclic-nucleotide phosphodiesterase-like n=1 Tax=Teratosphaeria destructans TaxID=418781 RepID=A0A9W7VZD8_9PEZI|nr:3',5'-cyclic-nucleotide phosphodiesterase-like [Teratosphaeria destructans]